MNTITAVILHYYPERMGNLEIIVEDLQNGSRAPDKIIVFNNDPKCTLKDDKITVINCGKNYFTRAKYVACLLEPSDFYLLLDDDVSVNKDTLSYMEYLIPADTTHFLTGPHGVILDGDSFSNGHNRLAREINEPIKVDSIVGNAVFCSFSALVELLKSETKVRLGTKEYLYEGDDILFGLVNRPLTIYPARDQQTFKYLSECGVNLNKITTDYGKMRDDFTKKALDILGR